MLLGAGSLAIAAIGASPTRSDATPDGNEAVKVTPTDGEKVSLTWVVNSNGIAPVSDFSGLDKTELTTGSNIYYKKILEYNDQLFYDLSFNETNEMVNQNQGEHNYVNFTVTPDYDFTPTAVSFNVILDGWGDGRLSAFITSGSQKIELENTVTPTRTGDSFNASILNHSFSLSDIEVAKGEPLTLTLVMFSKNNNGAGKGFGFSDVTFEGTVAINGTPNPDKPQYVIVNDPEKAPYDYGIEAQAIPGKLDNHKCVTYSGYPWDWKYEQIATWYEILKEADPNKFEPGTYVLTGTHSRDYVDFLLTSETASKYLLTLETASKDETATMDLQLFKGTSATELVWSQMGTPVTVNGSWSSKFAHMYAYVDKVLPAGTYVLRARFNVVDRAQEAIDHDGNPYIDYYPNSYSLISVDVKAVDEMPKMHSVTTHSFLYDDGKVTETDEYGYINKNPFNNSVIEGQEVTFTAKPAEGYMLKRFEWDTNSTSTETKVKLTADRDLAIRALFEKDPNFVKVPDPVDPVPGEIDQDGRMLMEKVYGTDILPIPSDSISIVDCTAHVWNYPDENGEYNFPNVVGVQTKNGEPCAPYWNMIMNTRHGYYFDYTVKSNQDSYYVIKVKTGRKNPQIENPSIRLTLFDNGTDSKPIWTSDFIIPYNGEWNAKYAETAIPVETQIPAGVHKLRVQFFQGDLPDDDPYVNYSYYVANVPNIAFKATDKQPQYHNIKTRVVELTDGNYEENEDAGYLTSSVTSQIVTDELLTITATPNRGYKFLYLIVNGEKYEDSTYSQWVYNDLDIQAVFEEVNMLNEVPGTINLDSYMEVTGFGGSEVKPLIRVNDFARFWNEETQAYDIEANITCLSEQIRENVRSDKGSITYLLNVDADGTYPISAYVGKKTVNYSNPDKPCTTTWRFFNDETGDEVVVGPVEMISTELWNNFRLQNLGNVDLKAGRHTLRIEFATGYGTDMSSVNLMKETCRLYDIIIGNRDELDPNPVKPDPGRYYPSGATGFHMTDYGIKPQTFENGWIDLSNCVTYTRETLDEETGMKSWKDIMVNGYEAFPNKYYEDPTYILTNPYSGDFADFLISTEEERYYDILLFTGTKVTSPLFARLEIFDNASESSPLLWQKNVRVPYNGEWNAISRAARPFAIVDELIPAGTHLLRITFLADKDQEFNEQENTFTVFEIGINGYGIDDKPFESLISSYPCTMEDCQPTVDPGAGTVITTVWNTQTNENKVTARCRENISVYAEANPGFKFLYFLLDGEVMETSQLRLDIMKESYELYAVFEYVGTDNQIPGSIILETYTDVYGYTFNVNKPMIKNAEVKFYNGETGEYDEWKTITYLQEIRGIGYIKYHLNVSESGTYPVSAYVGKKTVGYSNPDHPCTTTWTFTPGDNENAEPIVLGPVHMISTDAWTNFRLQQLGNVQLAKGEYDLTISFTTGYGEDGSNINERKETCNLYDIYIGERKTETPGPEVIPGDANGNGEVSVADAIVTAKAAVGIETEGFSRKAADVNKDGIITVSDAVGIIDIVLNQPAAPDTRATSEANITIDNLGSALGVALEDADKYVALQGDITVPVGMSIGNVVPGLGAAGHSIATRRIDARTLRVVLYNFGGHTFASGSPLLEMVLSGTDGEIAFGNLTACDANGLEHNLGSASVYVEGTTGVNSLGAAVAIAGGTGEVTVSGAAGLEVIVCSLDGKTIDLFAAESDSVRRSLQSGAYIVKVGSKVDKVIVK